MNKLKLLIGIALIFAASLYAKERVYLAPFSMVGLKEDYALVTERLMNAYIEDNGRFILVLHSDEDSAKVSNLKDANAKAIEKNCTKIIMAEFTRVGENVITSFKLYDINKDAPIWSDRLKAANPDDFDPIIQRVARNIGTKHKATNDDDIYTVTEQETKKLKKKSINTYIGLNVVGALTFSPNNGNGGLGLFAFYDAQNMFFSLDFSVTNLSEVQNEPSLIDLTLSLYYPFGTSNITPFAGGSISYSTRYTNTLTHVIDGEDDIGNGVSLRFGGGAVFNRASRILLIAQINYFIDLFETQFYEIKRDEDCKNEHDRTKEKKRIHGLRLSLGLAFGF